MKSDYQICTKCIMDTTDPDISFDDDGVCSHCHRYESIIRKKSYLRKREDGALDQLVEGIKRKGRGKRFDCIIGVSGGVDSTYVAYITKQLGLRPLAVHLDNGWNSDTAVANMKNVLEKLNIELETCVVDLEEFIDLQMAFLKASTPDSEIPTDHALLATLYMVAARENVQFVISGHNTSTEGGGVPAWSQGHGDWKYIKSVQRQFGTKQLKSFAHYGPLKFAYYTIIKKVTWVQLLDYLNYDKAQTLELLQEELGWEYYGGKHYESIYTRFIQAYVLPKKFGYNKKRLHLSSLVWSGQMSREQAIKEMAEVDYPLELQEQDKKFVLKKLGISNEEFEQIMHQPHKSFWDYPSYKKTFGQYKWLISIYHSLKRA